MARALFALIFVAITVLFVQAQSGPEVRTEYGVVEGLYASESQQFLGIPFATPPLGSLRWRAPERHAVWSGVRKTTQFSPRCRQSSEGRGESEDCLYLNVFTPRNATANSRLPVRIWIHGGAFVSGSASDNPAGILAAESNSVVVSINYRLGPLGFLVFGELLHESTRLNYGLQDQQMAMQWVQANIHAFGGDNSNVMIFGESAGGASVAFHMIMPDSWQFYHKAVLESPGRWHHVNMTTALNYGRRTIAANNCSKASNVLECMRALPASAISTSPFNIMPCIDQVQVKAPLVTLFKTGRFNTKAPVIIGSNEMEGNMWAWYIGEGEFGVKNFTFTERQYLDIVMSFITPFGPAVVPWYSSFAAQHGYWKACSQVIGDFVVNCGASFAAHHMAQHKTQQVWRYLFTQHSPNTGNSFLNATHGSEVAYVFKDPRMMGVSSFTPDEEIVANAMVQYWTAFHRTGDPNNAPGLYRWPKYTGVQKLRDTLVLNSKFDTITYPDTENCNKWVNILQAGID